MAPSSLGLEPRDRIRCDSYGNCYRYSTWNDWGRWVALAVIVGAVVFLGLAFSCFNNRRRRRRGMQPMYGTGWIPGNPGGPGKNNGHQQQHPGYNENAGYYANQPYNGGAAPPYSPAMGNQTTGNTFNSNDGYYGNNNYGNGQNGGIELQQPHNTYQPQRGGDAVYEAPHGAPPGKGDGIIR